LKYLRLAYIPASRYKLSKPLLDSKYKKAKVNVANKIKEASVLAIMTDGWIDTNETEILNTSEYIHFCILEIF